MLITPIQNRINPLLFKRLDRSNQNVTNPLQTLSNGDSFTRSGVESTNISFKRAMTEEEKDKMFYAISYKSIERLQELLPPDEDIDIDINEPIRKDWSALHYIGRNGWIEGYDYLKDKFNLDVNVQKNDGWTPLHLATYNKNVDMVKALLENKNIDITIKNREGFTAEVFATNHNEILKLFEDYKGNKANGSEIKPEPEAKTETKPRQTFTAYKRDAIYKAINEKNIQKLRGLLPTDADICIDEPIYLPKKWTILHYIGREGWVDGYEYIKNNFDFDVNIQGNNNGWTPLHFAVHNRQTNLVKKLLENDNIDLTLKDKEGKTVEDIAKENGCAEIADLLRDEAKKTNKAKKNVDINNLSAENNIYSNEEINAFFEFLINRKNYNQAIEMLEKTPLLDFDNEDLLRKIGRIGDVQLMNKVFEYKFVKQKPMLEEYEQKRKNFLENEIIKLSYDELKNNQMVLNTYEGFKSLLENRDFNPNDVVGNKSLFELACIFDSEGELVRQILSKYDNVSTEKMKNSTKNKKIKTLINEYETVGKYKIKLDKIKGMLLNSSTKGIGIKELKTFIESNSYGLDVSDSVGNTLLHITSTIADDSARGMIQKLITKGLDINTKNIAQQNSLISAIKAFSSAKDDVEKNSLLSNIKFLLDKGVNIDDQDKLGQTPFHYVCITTSAALLTLFLSKNPNVFIRDVKGNRAAKYLKTDEMKKIYDNYLRMI